MGYEISRREVLNNLIRFKDSLLEVHDRKGSDRRSYQILLNCKTGDMRFAKKISSLEYHISEKRAQKGSSEEWKEVQMIVFQDKAGVHFELSDKHNHVLKPTDLEALAWRVASETLDVLNQKGHDVQVGSQEMLPEEVVLEDLSSIHLGSPKEEISDLPGWVGSLGRLDAERRLQKQPPGTYLLREGDEITFASSFHFAEENLLSVHPYLLTVVESGEKISDFLILKTEKGWIFYHDDPNLRDKSTYLYHGSPRELLRTIGEIARHPIL